MSIYSMLIWHNHTLWEVLSQKLKDGLRLHITQCITKCHLRNWFGLWFQIKPIHLSKIDIIINFQYLLYIFIHFFLFMTGEISSENLFEVFEIYSGIKIWHFLIVDFFVADHYQYIRSLFHQWFYNIFKRDLVFKFNLFCFIEIDLYNSENVSKIFILQSILSFFFQITFKIINRAKSDKFTIII